MFYFYVILAERYPSAHYYANPQNWLRNFLVQFFLKGVEVQVEVNWTYRKIPKISPGAYIFQKPFFEGLIFEGGYIRRGLSTEGNLRLQIDWASLIVGSKFTVFVLFYFVFEGNFPSTSPGGLIFGGAI